jgi:hypothetical protein
MIGGEITFAVMMLNENLVSVSIKVKANIHLTEITEVNLMADLQR